MRAIHLILFFALDVCSLETYPIGINLGFKFITAAHFTSENKPELLSKIEGSEEYQSHIKKLLSHSEERQYKFGEVYIRDSSGELAPAPIEYRGYGKKEEEAIDQALRDSSKDLAHKLGYFPLITAITIPRGLDYIAKDHIYDTLCEGDAVPKVTLPWQVLGFLDATRSAYDLDSAEGLGLQSPINIYHDDYHLVLYVDYNANSLDFWVADVAEFTAGLVEQGPFSLRRPDLAASNQEEDELKANQLHQAIQQFMAEFSSTAEAEYLYAIIVSGEASPTSMDSLRRSLRQIVPQKWQEMIRDQLDATYVTAIGAAHRARKFVQRPDVWKVEDEHVHDEL